MLERTDRLNFLLGRWYDLETQLAIEQLLEKGNTVVDVGANYGAFALAASELVGTDGSVIAFEPSPYAFARLRTNIDLHRGITQIRVVNAGLSDVAGQLMLKVPEHNAGEASFADHGFAAFEAFECPIEVGDDVLANETVSCVKIDVEGFEVRVLQGMKQVIERDHPLIVTEVVRTHLQR